MEIATRHFGNVEIDENKIIKFEKGIFGFEDVSDFIVLYDGAKEDNPFAWLQAVANPDLCLPMVNPMLWYPTYSPDVDDELIGSIGELKRDDLEIYTVVVIPEDIKKMTTNLRAPIILNTRTKKGIQGIVNDEEYDIRHNLYDQLQALKEAGE